MSSYTPLTWSKGDAVTIERLNQMAENDQFLFEQVVKSKYIFDDAERTSGIKIFARNERFPVTGTKLSQLSVSWDGFFSPDCNPIVNVMVGRMDRNRLWVSAKGPGGENWPNSRGCEIHGVMDPDTPSNYNFGIFIPVHIMAVGY